MEAILAQAPSNRPGENGFKYRPQFGIVIVCRDEDDQRAAFEALAKQGYKLKVVSV